MTDEEAAEAEKQAERDWYQQEDDGGMVDETHNPFLGDDALFNKRQQEMQKKMVRAPHLCGLTFQYPGQSVYSAAHSLPPRHALFAPLKSTAQLPKALGTIVDMYDVLSGSAFTASVSQHFAPFCLGCCC
jgi:hypothetical protein